MAKDETYGEKLEREAKEALQKAADARKAHLDKQVGLMRGSRNLNKGRENQSPEERKEADKKIVRLAHGVAESGDNSRGAKKAAKEARQAADKGKKADKAENKATRAVRKAARNPNNKSLQRKAEKTNKAAQRAAKAVPKKKKGWFGVLIIGGTTTAGIYFGDKTDGSSPTYRNSSLRLSTYESNSRHDLDRWRRLLLNRIEEFLTEIKDIDRLYVSPERIQ